MFAFLVILLGPILVCGLQLEESSGLSFDVHQEYANSYEDYKPSDYKFEYGVSDPHTGDHKSHWEVKENGVVRGEYRLLEPDGTTRIVQYTADDHNGFRATVKKIGHGIHPPSIQQPSVVYNAPSLPELHQHYNTQPYFKAYDGSGENYINALPTQIPFHEDGTIRDHQLSFILSGVHPQEVAVPHQVTNHYGIESLRTLDAEPYSIQNTSPLREVNHVDVPPVEIVNKEEFMSGHIEESGYIPEKASLDYREYPSIHQPLHLQEPVRSQHFVSENNEYIPLPIHMQNGNGNPEKSFVTDDLHSSVEEPLSLGMRIDHPHGESFSSFYVKTGNAEDDSAYKSYGNSQTISGW